VLLLFVIGDVLFGATRLAGHAAERPRRQPLAVSRVAAAAAGVIAEPADG
jgi:hypothetical protein